MSTVPLIDAHALYSAALNKMHAAQTRIRLLDSAYEEELYPNTQPETLSELLAAIQEIRWKYNGVQARVAALEAKLSKDERQALFEMQFLVRQMGIDYDAVQTAEMLYRADCRS